MAGGKRAGTADRHRDLPARRQERGARNCFGALMRREVRFATDVNGQHRKTGWTSGAINSRPPNGAQILNSLLKISPMDRQHATDCWYKAEVSVGVFRETLA